VDAWECKCIGKTAVIGLTCHETLMSMLNAEKDLQVI